MKRIVDELIEDALRELADEERQRTLWLSTGSPEVSSFVECMSRLWDDSGLAAAMEQPGFVYDKKIDEELHRLDAILGHMDADQQVDRLLTDPYLIEARGMAQTLLQDIRRFGHDAASS
jgi:hypothetical protein